ncbi:MAG: DEAD/DEAH box helicase [Desulfobacteraceae bacterium]|jgi:non-specific serine/threonine protein kinase|nr:DEAD/DEAH box helicase [Desulfobacteraceae bacterium]
MPPPLPNRELSVVVLPSGTLQTEWIETKEKIQKSSRLLQEEIYNRFVDDAVAGLLFLGFSDKNVKLSPSLEYWRDVAGLFTRELSRTPDLELSRHKANITVAEDQLVHFTNSAPLMPGSEYISTELLKTIWSNLNTAFCRAIKAYKGTVAEFIRTYSPEVHLVGRVFFHLVENKDEDQPFAFLATYSTRLNQQGKSKHLPLKYALKEYESDRDKLLELLATVHLAAGQSPLLARLLDSGELFHPMTWSSTKAFSFLKEVAVYENCGILCRIPNWWQGKPTGVGINISVGDTKPSLVGMDEILNFDIRLVLGDIEISPEEAKRLLQESEGLAFIKNKWVAVDPEKLKQTLKAYEKAKKMMAEQGLSLKEAMRLQLTPEKFLDASAAEINCSVSSGKWLESVLKKLRNPDLISAVKPGRAFKAALREYQQKGLNWLLFLHSLRFGACLADDMGLGKTVQVLGFLHILKSGLKKSGSPHRASLLVIPASLISNWVNEISRFAPGIKYFVAHPAANSKTRDVATDKKSLNTFDLVITTYALVQKYTWLQTHSWNYVILDEAQAIKNPATKQAKAAKSLSCRNRIIMTGTPIENRLSDLWSLFDFLNPGLLGNINEFKKFSKKLSGNPSGYFRLRQLIRPYILRRLKTDKTVISDLPEKIEMRTYAALSKKQILLYKNLTLEIKERIARTDGIQRKGIILSSLMKFKQLCNHPDQYLGTSGYGEKESGKFVRLREICETIYEKREKVLVFTQFKEITQPLAEFLAGIFQREGLILHGSIPVGKRKKTIEKFQSPAYVPFMVLSLKAGGIGLNLTEANHVIHFDRWWNPAVENQATDRAFRIGQKKNVVVHKFLTKGTVEERIDMMLREKTRLSQDIIAAAGESWITEMKDDQLLDLFKLTL